VSWSRLDLWAGLAAVAVTTWPGEGQPGSVHVAVQRRAAIHRPGLGLLRWLSDQARLSQLTRARPDLLRRLLAVDGPDATERLLPGCFRARTPRLWPAEEGAQFAAWLAGRGRQSAGCC